MLHKFKLLSAMCLILNATAVIAGPVDASHSLHQGASKQMGDVRANGDHQHGLQNLLNLHVQQCRTKMLDLQKFRSQVPKEMPKGIKQEYKKNYVTQVEFDKSFKDLSQDNDKRIQEIQKLVDTVQKSDKKTNDEIANKIALFSNNCDSKSRDYKSYVEGVNKGAKKSFSFKSLFR